MDIHTNIGELKFVNDYFIHFLVQTVFNFGSYRSDLIEVFEILISLCVDRDSTSIIADFLSHGEIPCDGLMITSEDLGLAFDHAKLEFLTLAKDTMKERDNVGDDLTSEQHVNQHMFYLSKELESRILTITDIPEYKKFLKSVTNNGNIDEYIKDILIYYIEVLQEGEVLICTG